MSSSQKAAAGIASEGDEAEDVESGGGDENCFVLEEDRPRHRQHRAEVVDIGDTMKCTSSSFDSTQDGSSAAVDAPEDEGCFLDNTTIAHEGAVVGSNQQGGDRRGGGKAGATTGGVTFHDGVKTEADNALRHRRSSHHHRRPRSKSLDALDHSSSAAGADKSYLYSFRMAHHDATNEPPATSTSFAAAASAASASGGGGTAPASTFFHDYNFVLDNYVEYADETKIPRLRGRDVNRLTAAIHSSHWAVLCATVTAACFLTYSLSNRAPHLSADVSQAVVVTLVLATFPEVAASGGAGAFAGMAGGGVIPHYGWLALLSLVTSGLWLTFHRYKVLVGCGGRLGTCAFIAMNVTVAIFGMPSGAVSWSYYGDATRLWSERLELVPSILTVVASAFLSAAGGAIRLTSKIPLNPVQAPITLSLLLMLILEPTGFAYTSQIDAGLAVGSYVAMASEQYLPTVLDFGGAGFVAGLWILLLEPFFLEFGGKKGFTSFCGFATYVAVSRAVPCLRRGFGLGRKDH